MKNARKLLPAIAMLLISAVMMSTASFAWFSTNTTATANGMTVKIATAKTILIKDSSEAETEYSTLENHGITKDSMKPVSTVTPENTTDGTIAVPTFWRVKQGGAGGIVPGSAAYAEDTVFENDTENYLTKTVNLRATGEMDETNGLGKMTLQVVVTEEAEKTINDSLRILVAVKDGNNVTWYRFAPLGGVAIKPIESYDEDGTPKTTVAENAETLSNSGAAIDIVSKVVAEQVYTVTYYIWFEGQDATCMANNATDLKNITVTFNFNLVEVGG